MKVQTVVRQYNADGFVIVRQVFSAAELASLKQHVRDFIRDVVPTLEAGDVYFEDTGHRAIKSIFRMAPHDPYFQQLADDQRIRGLAEALLPGADVVCRGVGLFGKPAGDGSVVPSHQDNIFQHLAPSEALTVTIAIDESTVDNGALIFRQGSHRLGMLPHRPSGTMGFSMALIDEQGLAAHQEVPICLKPGDITVHHITTVHRSDANRTDRDRRQLAIGYRTSRACPDEDALARHRALLAELHAAHGA